MTAAIRAIAEHDFERQSVRVQVGDTSGDRTLIYSWGFAEVRVVEPHTRAPDDSGLWMPEDVARAVYEALADHFGHSGHDTRALRRDYDAERARVDLLIRHLIGGAA